MLCVPHALTFSSSVNFASRSDRANLDIRSSCSIMVDQSLKWGRANSTKLHVRLIPVLYREFYRPVASLDPVVSRPGDCVILYQSASAA